jgi:hypothetical protein
MPFAVSLLLATVAIAAIGCENTAPSTRRIPGPDDYVVAEGWDSFSVATVDTYRLRARKVSPCAPIPEPPSTWVTHALPGLHGATLRVPPDLAESLDTMPDSSMTSEFLNKGTEVLVMFSPHGNDSPGPLPAGCATRIADYETSLYIDQSRQARGLDSIFSVQVSLALPESFGVYIQLGTNERQARLTPPGLALLQRTVPSHVLAVVVILSEAKDLLLAGARSRWPI